MADLSPLALGAVAAGAALVSGLLRTSVGGGIGLALTPVLSVFLPAQFVLGLIATLLSFSDPIALRLFWGQWDRRLVWLVLPTMLVGIVLGAWGIAGLSDRALKKTIGAVALAFTLLQWGILTRRVRLGAAQSHWATGATVGFCSGVASSVAHSGGVILSPYLAGLGLSNASVIGTATAVVAFSNTLKLVSYWGIGFLTGQILWLGLLALPVLYAGAWLGWRLNRWLPRRWFALALLAIAAVGSLRLLLG